MLDIARDLVRIQSDLRGRATELHGHSVSLDRLKGGWSALWPYLNYRELRVLPLMLEKCPDLAGRVELWNCLDVEFGGTSDTSRTAELRRLLTRLDLAGCTEQPASGGVEVPAIWAGYEALSFVEALGGALHAHYIASGELFAIFAKQLAQHGIGLDDPALAYLQRGLEVSTRGLESAQRLALRYVTTDADRERWLAHVVRHLHGWLELR